MIATSSILTALGCTKFVFGGGSARTPLGKLTAPGPLAGLRGTNSKGGEKGEVNGEGEGKGRGKEGETPPPVSHIPGSAPASCSTSATAFVPDHHRRCIKVTT